MSRLGKFLGLPQEFEVESMGKVNIYPLKVNDIKLFKQNATPEEQLIMSKEIIKRSLQDEKDITDEEIDSLPLQIFTELMEKINEVNGFTENESAIRRIKEQNIRVQ
jgi:hypothetical protein